MAYTSINKPSDYFNTVIYSGSGSNQTISGVGFQSDMTWFKNRNNTANHALQNSVVGAGRRISPDRTVAEGDEPNGLGAWNSDGFTFQGDYSGNGYNASGRTYVAWNWKAGTAFSNDASATSIGTIDSTGSVNDTAGFSIISYNGTGSNGSIKHGLSTAPKAMFFKNRDEGAEGWFVYHELLGNTKRLLLDDGVSSSSSSTFFQNTSPTSSIITLGSNHGCNGPDAMICFAFAEKKGYSKFGKYRGNSSSDGVYVHLGFKPACIIVKSDASEHWEILDNKRSNLFNPVDGVIFPSLNNAEETTNNICDFLSNGVKFRHSDGRHNSSSHDTFYLAFAESPFVNSNGVPNNAR